MKTSPTNGSSLVRVPWRGLIGSRAPASSSSQTLGVHGGLGGPVLPAHQCPSHRAGSSSGKVFVLLHGPQWQAEPPPPGTVSPCPVAAGPLRLPLGVSGQLALRGSRAAARAPLHPRSPRLLCLTLLRVRLVDAEGTVPFYAVDPVLHHAAGSRAPQPELQPAQRGLCPGVRPSLTRPWLAPLTLWARSGPSHSARRVVLSQISAAFAAEHFWDLYLVGQYIFCVSQIHLSPNHSKVSYAEKATVWKTSRFPTLVLGL